MSAGFGREGAERTLYRHLQPLRALDPSPTTHVGQARTCCTAEDPRRHQLAATPPR